MRGLVVLAAVVWLVAWSTRPVMPGFDAVRAAARPSEARLLDRHGAVLHELRVDPRRRRFPWTALADVSPALLEAIVASEDRRFRQHRGVDWWAFGSALRGRPRGGSTITMQLAALIEPGLGRSGVGWRTVLRKGRQMRAAWALERGWSKEEILEAYLNLVPFRGEVEGVGAAAAVLFDKAPHGLDRAEAAVLAASVQAPNAPAVMLRERAARLASDGAAIAAAVAGVVDAGVGRGPHTALAPHLAHRLLHPDTITDVRSTVDRDLQALASEALHRQLLAVRAQKVEDGAVLVVDNASGDVLAYVGSSGALSAAPAVDGVLARRQPGSALKPFVYGLAVARQLLTVASPLDDLPLEVATVGGLYRPRNYDDQFRGVVPLRAALASSLNVPAVRTLLLLGADPVAQHLRDLGFAGIVHDGEWYGPGLALGAAEVSLWEIVDAYRALANGGLWTPLRLTADPPRDAGRRIYPRDVAWLIADVLADRDARAATFGLDSPLATGFWSAVKTGTSKDMRDNWCVGFTAAVTVGAWVGNASGRPMRDVSGVTGAAPVWQEVITAAQRQWPARAPSPPPELVRAGEEWFVAGTEPQVIAAPRAPARPQIVTPTAESLLAIDPDLPASRQRVMFRARGTTTAARWRLDGDDLGGAHAPFLWAPSPGRHQLRLVDADAARVLDQVQFVVRGR